MPKRLSFLIATALLTAHAAQAQLPPPEPSNSQPSPESQQSPNSQPSPGSTASPRAMTPPRATPPHVIASPHSATTPHANTLRARNAPGAAAGDATVITGRVQQWLLNPNGEADGFLLADGTQVAFPPHLSAAMTAAVHAGDRVQVTGWRAPDVPVMRMQSLAANGQVVTDQPPARGRAAPRRKDSGALGALSANGRIDRLLYNDRGDLHGVVLADKTIVRFPPHVGARLADQMTVGKSLSAVGWGTRVAQGTALEATQLGTSPDSLTDVLSAGVQPRPVPAPMPASASVPGAAPSPAASPAPAFAPSFASAPVSAPASASASVPVPVPSPASAP